MRTVLRGTAVSLFALLLVVQAFAAPVPQSPGTVRIGQIDTSRYPVLTLYVNVRDAAGRPLGNLHAGDFQLHEDGQPARVIGFAGMGGSRPVDIVFVFDTTGSMEGEVATTRERCIAFADALVRQGRDYRLGLVTFWDDVQGVYPEGNRLSDDVGDFKQWLEGIHPRPGQGGNEPENAYGAILRAIEMPFRARAQRVLVLITDAPPHHTGDSPDSGVRFDDPNLALEPVLARLRAQGVVVYVVGPDLREYRELASGTGGTLYPIAGDFSAIVTELGETLGGQYRLTYRAPRPAFDGSRRTVQVMVGSVSAQATYLTPTRPPRASGFFTFLRTPLQISTDPRVVGTNLLLAILIALLFGLTSTVLNDTLNAHRDRFDRSLLGRAVAALGRAGRAVSRPVESRPRGRAVLAFLPIALFLALTAFVACLLDPSFRPFSWAGLGLFFSMVFSIGLVNLTYEGSQVWRARRLHLDAVLKLNPLGILAALACVLFSRLVGFLPGYLYGVVGGYALAAEAQLNRRQEATIAGAGLWNTGLLALLAWGATVPTALLQGVLAPSGFGGALRSLVGGVQSLLLALFFVGLEVVFLELFPVGPTSGATLFRWSKAVWGIAFGLVAFLAFHTLLTPESAFLDSVRSQSLQLLLGVLAVYSLVTVLLWFFFEGRAGRVAGQACPACAQAIAPGARFCPYCGTALPPAPARAVVRQGLVLVVAVLGLWLAIGIVLLLTLLGVA